MSDPTASAPNPKQQELDERFKKEISEANALLDWAVASSKLPTPSNDDEGTKQVEMVETIRGGYEKLNDVASISGRDRATFDRAYARLVALLKGPTYRTLQATADEEGEVSVMAPRAFVGGAKVSAARIWSRKLWMLTLGLLLLVMVAENFDEYLDLYSPADSQSIADEGGLESYYRLSYWLAVVLPFFYGALGACAFLLRSCHKFLHERSFDPNRIPEYLSRLLLGFLAGGAVLLFTTDEGALIGGDTTLSGAALAFLAGYSTDFLYTTLERVAAAVMPKRVATDDSASAPTPAKP